ncbi:MAG: hypothetical protein ACREF3_12875 [Acetobacteraceae bacterium]
MKMKRPSNLLLPVLAVLTACAATAAATDTDNLPAANAVANNTASASRPPLVIQNPDGTMTVQKELPKGEPKDAEAKEGLVIPPQIIVPATPAHRK